jgi:monoamine oxidase
LSEHLIDRRTALGGALAGTAAAAFPAAASAATREKRVSAVVVGAGISGLYAAELLKKAGRSVVILEAGDRVGGRILNLKTGPKSLDVTEGGAEWIGPGQRIMGQLLRRFHLKTFKNYTKGDSTLVLGGKVTHFNGIAPLPGDAVEQVVAAFAELTLMAADVPVKAPWNADFAAEWDNQTAQSWIEANVSNRIAREVVGVAMGGPVSVSAQDISLLHYLFIAAAAGGPSNLITVGSGVLTHRVVGGTGLLVDGLARPLRSIIKLNTPVTSIEHGYYGAVRVTTPHGSWVADQVIVAMSPTMTQQILFDPVLPVPRTQSVQRTGNGSAIKAYPIYRKPFWRAKGLNGIVQSNSLPFNASFDNSPPDGSVGVLLALIENVEARRLSQMSLAARKAEVVNAFALAFGEEARHPIGYVEKDWSSDPWVRGGAASFFAPGMLTEYRYLFDKPIGRVHFAGAETGTAFWGNMEAALQSGERAAREVLRG